MENNLFPTGYETEIIEETDLQSEQPQGFKNGLAFDYSNGDFVRDGQNRIVDSDGIESWKSWVMNCIQTERYKHLCYSTDFGIEWDMVYQAQTREEAESILTRQINEAVMADKYKRTEYIEDITYNWTAPDAVEVHITIHGINDVTIDVTAYITKGDL